MATIFDHLLKAPKAEGITAIIVYPMNALINSQTNELRNYSDNYRDSRGSDFPITFGQYTGQGKARCSGRYEATTSSDSPPNKFTLQMLELLLTRAQERGIRDAIYENLRYLVFDELHTYRGRQGSDIAMLIRRICERAATASNMYRYISATLISGRPPSDTKS